jgi:mannose/cellobiose epimerase-like protein (N-acyl-D-glucosamine 2-epimerase family)
MVLQSSSGHRSTERKHSMKLYRVYYTVVVQGKYKRQCWRGYAHSAVVLGAAFTHYTDVSVIEE